MQVILVYKPTYNWGAHPVQLSNNSYGFVRTIFSPNPNIQPSARITWSWPGCTRKSAPGTATSLRRRFWASSCGGGVICVRPESDMYCVFFFGGGWGERMFPVYSFFGFWLSRLAFVFQFLSFFVGSVLGFT